MEEQRRKFRAWSAREATLECPGLERPSDPWDTMAREATVACPGLERPSDPSDCHGWKHDSLPSSIHEPGNDGACIDVKLFVGLIKTVN